MKITNFNETESAKSLNYKQNHGSREGTKIDSVILHSVHGNIIDNGKHISAEEIFYTYGVAPHYLIKKDGSVISFVDEEFSAYHAGVSQFDGKVGFNKRSIGIEIESFGPVEELVNGKFHHLPGKIKHAPENGTFQEAQYESLLELLKEIYSRHEITYLLGHSDISAGRKNDPGENFDWEKLAEQGFEAFVNKDKVKFFDYSYLKTQESDKILKPGDTGENVKHLQQLLFNLGYDSIEINGNFDEKTLSNLVAFKLHHAKSGSNFGEWHENEDIHLVAELVGLDEFDCFVM